MAKSSTRDSLVTAGLSVMVKTGYNGSSVRDVVAAAGLPSGSFSNHFRSKEDFALKVLERYFDGIREVLRDALGDDTRSPRQRLIRYFEIVTRLLAEENWGRGCLIGDLSLEATCQNDVLRIRLGVLFTEWVESFASCIAHGQAAGEISSDLDPLDLAEFLLASWHGAVLRMKIDRTPAALERFKKIMFDTVFIGRAGPSDGPATESFKA